MGVCRNPQGCQVCRTGRGRTWGEPHNQAATKLPTKMSKFLMKGEGGAKAELRRRMEVRKYFNRADKNGDGKLTKEEWHIEKIFKNMDKNGDGFVTKAEFKDLCKNLTTDQVEVAFRQFDTSGDEKLNYKEFCLMIIQREQERAAQQD